MLGGMRTKVRWRAYKGKIVAITLLVVIGAMMFSGFACDIGRALLYRLPSDGLAMGSSGPIDDGPLSLEERILESDVVARVRLLSVSPNIETFYFAGFEYDGGWFVDMSYGSALEFRFEALEYLKGGGSGEIVGIAHSMHTYESKPGAFAFGEDLTETRDIVWDDREAIVFLRKDQTVVSTTQQSDRYVLGTADSWSSTDNYTIDSRYSKKWLPAAKIVEVIDKTASPASADGNSGEKRFLTGAKRAEGESYAERIDYRVADSGYNKALGTGGDSSTITLSRLKDLIAELQAEVDAGDGSEEYSRCVVEKYRRYREVEYKYKLSDGVTYGTIRYDHKLASGSHADTVFARGTRPFQIPDNLGPSDITYANDFDIEGWLEGEDAHLFHIVDEIALVGNLRPLPMGDYRFYINSLNAKYVLCNAYPDRLRTSEELVVDVFAPEGALHEAFFDPVNIDDAVGADNANGELEPMDFEYDDREAAIEALRWRDGQVELTLEVEDDLPDLASHRMDFIALDGSVALRLLFEDAIEFADEDDIATFVWGVCEQPWQNGDLLMLRIAASVPADGVQATNDLECLATVPEPTPEPEPTATPEPAPTATPETAPTATPEPAPTATPEPAPTATPEPAPTATPEPAPTATPEPAPTATPETAPTAAPEPAPTATPEPSAILRYNSS